MKKYACLLVMVMGFGLAASANNALAATECNGFVVGDVNGGVVVNNGDVCFLGGNILLGPGTLHLGAHVTGGVTVNTGGVLFVCASTINGGIAADGAATLIVGAEEILCDGVVINGAVEISNSAQGDIVHPDAPPPVALENSVINGAVHLTGNLGHIAVMGNRLSGGLFCKNNVFDLDDEGTSNVITGKVTCEFE